MMRLPARVARPFVGLALALVAVGAWTQEPKLLPPGQAFAFSARALDERTLEARFNIADGYYMYRDRFSFEVASTVPGPIVPRYPRGQMKDDEFFGRVETYRGLAVITLPLPRAAPGSRVTLKAGSQGCADVGVCYPPQLQEVTLEVPAAGRGPGPLVEAAEGKLPWQR
jgi:thiol:disulfide interchange protein DsbD